MVRTPYPLCIPTMYTHIVNKKKKKIWQRKKEYVVTKSVRCLIKFKRQMRTNSSVRNAINHCSQ